MKRAKKYITADAAGFSFVELMTVIALLGILAAIAVPNFLRSLPEKRLKGAARNLYVDLQKARLLAVKQNKNIPVRFDAAGYYFDEDNNGEYTDGEFRNNLADSGTDVEYGSDAANNNWNGDECTQIAAITFFPRGTANSGSRYLQSQNNKKICYAVTVTDFGAVRIRRFSSGSGWE